MSSENNEKITVDNTTLDIKDELDELEEDISIDLGTYKRSIVADYTEKIVSKALAQDRESRRKKTSALEKVYSAAKNVRENLGDRDRALGTLYVALDDAQDILENS